MATIDPVWASVAELSRAFEARTLSPVDAVEALLGRIRRRNPMSDPGRHRSSTDSG